VNSKSYSNESEKKKAADDIRKNGHICRGGLQEDHVAAYAIFAARQALLSVSGSAAKISHQKWLLKKLD